MATLPSGIRGYYTDATDIYTGPAIVSMQTNGPTGACVTNFEVCAQQSFSTHGVKEIADYGISYGDYEVQVYWFMKLDANGNTVPF
jgi:hypothetical protein